MKCGDVGTRAAGQDGVALETAPPREPEESPTAQPLVLCSEGLKLCHGKEINLSFRLKLAEKDHVKKLT